MVRTAYVDKGQTVGAIEQLIRGTQVGNGFPNKDGFCVRLWRHNFLAKRGDLGDEVSTSIWGAY